MKIDIKKIEHIRIYVGLKYRKGSKFIFKKIIS